MLPRFPTPPRREESTTCAGNANTTQLLPSPRCAKCSHGRASVPFEFAGETYTSVGMVSINNSTSGAEAHLPFGGNGKSGNGSRQSGVWVLDQFTRWQAVNWDYAGKLQRAQMDVAEIEADLDFRL